ncbi:MAG: twin-arginine translocation signal domain-containing protein [Planctomycetaceae bacterium]|nr:twin-arginine translocation signal domain-containing protein [Planctomycetaceae bacterium]
MSSTFIRSFKLTRRHFLQNAAAIAATL